MPGTIHFIHAALFFFVNDIRKREKKPKLTAHAA
jgi:hypothetical protein